MTIEATDGGGHVAAVPRSASRFLTRASKQVVIGLALLSDIAVIGLTGWATCHAATPPGFSRTLIACAIVAALIFVAVMIGQRFWAYTIAALAAPARQIRVLLVAILGAFVTVTGALFLIGIDVMAFRLWFLLWLLAAITILVPLRFAISLATRGAERRGVFARRAVVVGGGKDCESLILRLARSGSRAIRILGVFDDRSDERSPETIGLFRKIGTFSELESYCRENQVDLLIIALPPSAEERILQLIRKLWELPIDVRIAALSSRLRLSKRAYTYIGDVPFLAVFDRPLSDWNATIKAISDRVGAALAILVFAPVMLVVAIAIRLDSRGPILFRQRRYGFNNEIIHVLKFRSMYVEMADHNAARQVTRDDPRVTRVGRFIRRTSLDELPQFFNVLRGELSLVGPRPHAIETKAGSRLYQDVVDGYFARHRMKPGITGWAQINGWRGETDTIEKLERRVEHDLHYIENWSLGLDLYILAMTPLSLISARNAY